MYTLCRAPGGLSGAGLCYPHWRALGRVGAQGEHSGLGCVGWRCAAELWRSQQQQDVVGWREVACSLCAQSHLQAFSRIITPGWKKPISLKTWGWEEKEEGVRAESCWPGQHYFLHSCRTPWAEKAKALTKNILLFCILCFLPGCHWRCLEEMAAIFSISFPVPYRFRANLGPRASRFQPPCHAPGSVHAMVLLAAGVNVALTPQHTKRRWYSGMASGLVALFMWKKQPAWVSLQGGWAASA